MANASIEDLDVLLDGVFTSTPLLFVKGFLREHRKRARQVHIGASRSEVRANLRDAIVAKRISISDVEKWQQEVEGWGKQHLYLSRVPSRIPAQANLLNTAGLKNFLKRKGLWASQLPDAEASVHSLTEMHVDDETARITWRTHAIDYEHCKELDYVDEREDAEYEFRAFKMIPRRSASRLIIRKTDGIVAELVDLPQGDDHTSVRNQITEVARAVLAPLSPRPIALSPILSALDEGAVARSGPRPKRPINLGVAPTKARYRTDGAEVEFRSTREASGYTESEAVRHVRRAMRIESFEGEAGKFRLTFEGSDRQSHDMIVSLNATGNRIYLFSRMSEHEVLTLVDQLIAIA